MKVCIEVGCTAVVGRRCKGLCSEHYHVKYRDVNRERINAARQKYRQGNPEKVAECGRNRRYELFFNLRPSEYDVMREYQAQDPDYRLLLGKPTAKTRDHIEHRHSDGLIRGVMAAMLNRAYGLIERLYPNNTAEVLRALAKFHEDPPGPKALGETVYGVIGKAQRKKVVRYGPKGDLRPHVRLHEK